MIEHESIVLKAGKWHGAWQWVETEDDDGPGLGFFIPPMEYTIRPGDRLITRSTSLYGRNVAVSVNGSPFVPYE